MHYIFIPSSSRLFDYPSTLLYYDSTNTFAETDVSYSRMQLQTSLLCVDVALSRRQCTFCVN